MKAHRKKIKIRQRVLAAYSAVLFFSFALTGIIFNIAIRVLDVDLDYNLAEIAGASEGVGRIGIILVVLISVMFIVAVIVTYFLSNSITRPIEKLSEFALDIGSGNFVPNDLEFNDSELEDLNNALNKSVKQLAIYDGEQRAFFQNASHELRTPLMSIKCYAEGINFGLMDPVTASETILQETDKLSELVADLLYISKIDNITTAYTVAEVDLLEIVRDCAMRQQVVADKKQIRFYYDFSGSAVSYECAAELISRAVDNLISNAIRYASSKVVLSCHKKDSDIEISVSDDGNGVDAEDLPHVFERFYKGRGGNHGIGLSIVKSIVLQHNGHIKAENSKEGGAVFSISLPIEFRF